MLLGAGFFVASILGPPDALERVAGYFQGPQPPEVGLQPVAGDAPSLRTDAWPALPAASEESAPAADEPNGGWGGPVAPSVDRASWPAPEASADSRPVLPGPASWDGAADPPALPELTPPKRPLKPIPRGGAAQATRGEAPATPRSAQAAVAPPGSAPAERGTAERGTLADSPYGKRPAYDPAVGGVAWDAPADDAFAPLPGPAAIERTAAVGDYQQHVVSDGDTLEELAERYLGDAARAGEIYELNRDRLDSPDLLPIGMVLRTPTLRAYERPADRSAPTGDDASATGGVFSTVSSATPHRAARPLTRVEQNAEPRLSDEQRLGPVDPLYSHEVMWGASPW